MMWRLTVVAISVLLAAQQGVAHPPRGIMLDSPYALKTWHDSDTSVSVSWKFTLPAYVSLKDITFVILVKSDAGNTSEHFSNFDQEPLRFLITNLKPSTAYSVVIEAHYKDFAVEDSVSATMYFRTMDVDWSTPKIIRVLPKDSGYTVEHTVSWEIDHAWSYPRFIEVEYCAPKSKTERKSGSAAETTFPLEFGIAFNVTVTAFYGANDVDLVHRSSTTFNGYSPVGRPGRIKGLKRVEQSGKFLKINWEPPVNPKGPISYYEVDISDPKNPLRKTRKIVTEPSVEAKGPRLIGKAYEVVIRPVNVDHKNVSYPGPFTYFRLNKEVPPPREKVKILERTPHLIRFKLSHENLDMRTFVQVETDVKAAQVKITAEEAEVSNLEPHSLVHVKARLCKVDEDTEIEYCGDHVHFELRSNVAAPSPVQSLRFTSVDDKEGACYDAQWERPLEPRGPIDGYDVGISDGTRYFSMETDVKNMKSTKRRVCDRFHGHYGLHMLMVTAFNYDLQNRAVAHPGKVASVLLHEHGPSYLWPILITIFITAVFSAVGFWSGAAQYERRKQRMAYNIRRNLGSVISQVTEEVPVTLPPSQVLPQDLPGPSHVGDPPPIPEQNSPEPPGQVPPPPVPQHKEPEAEVEGESPENTRPADERAPQQSVRARRELLEQEPPAPEAEEIPREPLNQPSTSSTDRLEDEAGPSSGKPFRSKQRYRGKR